MSKYQNWNYSDSSYPFDKEVFVIANYNYDDAWLRKDKCSGSCGDFPAQKISNIKLTQKPIPPPPPCPPPRPHYEYGLACGSKDDGQCAFTNCPSVDHCRWSWPKGSSWDDPDADCRCDVNQPWWEALASF